MRKEMWQNIGILFGIPLLVLAVALLINTACSSTLCEEECERDLQLVVSDIAVDITIQRVYARDFVRTIHTGTSTTTRVGAVKLEFISLTWEAPYWENEYPLDCGMLGENEVWVRIQDDGKGSSKAPVRAYLEVSDSEGQCGEWQFNPGQNEEDTE